MTTPAILALASLAWLLVLLAFFHQVGSGRVKLPPPAVCFLVIVSFVAAFIASWTSLIWALIRGFFV